MSNSSAVMSGVAANEPFASLVAGRRNRPVHWGVTGWRPTRAGRRGTTATGATFVGVYTGRNPRAPSPRCRIFVACKFGSCHASFIFIPCGVYPLTSSAALRAEFPGHSQVGKRSAETAACTTNCRAAARSSGPRVTSTSSRRKLSRRPRTAIGRRADPHMEWERRPSVAGGREPQPRDGLPVDNPWLSTGAVMSSSSAMMPGLSRPASTNEKGVRARRPSYIRARTPVRGVNGSVVAAPGTAGR